MIDIRELRIGSTVLYNGERVKVQRIEGDDVIDAIICERGWIPIKDLDPIPITEKLLKELGFVEHGQCMGYPFWRKDRIEAQRLHDAKWRVDFNNGEYVVVKYLHEAEAFVYLTTKQELI